MNNCFEFDLVVDCHMDNNVDSKEHEQINLAYN